MSNTFGFGGHNACVVFKKFENHSSKLNFTNCIFEPCQTMS